jgi:hypothetical protein
MVFPSSGFFLSVDLLIEFTPQGLVIPSRFDVYPFKFSGFVQGGFHTFINVMIFLMVLFNFSKVVRNFIRSGSIREALRFRNLSFNGLDIVIILLQTFSFSCKVMDA